jgi:hypothetical protein
MLQHSGSLTALIGLSTHRIARDDEMLTGEHPDLNTGGD